MKQDLFVFFVWFFTRLERPLRRLCAPPLPVATLLRWWVRQLWLFTRPPAERPEGSHRYRPAALPYPLYPLSCILLE
jgi:hypothetical protein